MKKKIILASGIVIAAVLIVFFLKGLGTGGGGQEAETNASPKEVEVTATATPTKEVKETEEILQVVTVTIKENLVYIGDKTFSNATELKEYVEEVNKDGREFKMKEENAILETYEWVTKVFTDLKIPLVPIEE